MGRERRQHIRLNADGGLVCFSMLDGRKSRIGKLLNLSEGGLRFNSNFETFHLRVDDQVILHVSMGTPRMLLDVVGQVRSIKQNPAARCMEVSIMFMDLDKKQKDTLKKTVLDLARHKIRKKSQTGL